MSLKSFDGCGNYNFGLDEQLMFPEVQYDQIQQIRGMDIAIVTTAKTDREGFALLQAFGMPFQKSLIKDTTIQFKGSLCSPPCSLAARWCEQQGGSVWVALLQHGGPSKDYRRRSWLKPKALPPPTGIGSIAKENGQLNSKPASLSLASNWVRLLAEGPVLFICLDTTS